MVKFSILNREKSNSNPTEYTKKVKVWIFNREKSNSYPTQYKKKSSLGLLIMKNRIQILSNIKKSQVLDFESRKIEF
jgi:hypothetical protein